MATSSLPSSVTTLRWADMTSDTSDDVDDQPSVKHVASIAKDSQQLQSTKADVPVVEGSLGPEFSRAGSSGDHSNLQKVTLVKAKLKDGGVSRYPKRCDVFCRSADCELLMELRAYIEEKELKQRVFTTEGIRLITSMLADLDAFLNPQQTPLQCELHAIFPNCRPAWTKSFICVDEGLKFKDISQLGNLRLEDIVFKPEHRTKITTLVQQHQGRIVDEQILQVCVQRPTPTEELSLLDKRRAANALKDSTPHHVCTPLKRRAANALNELPTIREKLEENDIHLDIKIAKVGGPPSLSSRGIRSEGDMPRDDMPRDGWVIAVRNWVKCRKRFTLCRIPYSDSAWLDVTARLLNHADGAAAVAAVQVASAAVPSAAAAADDAALSVEYLAMKGRVFEDLIKEFRPSLQDLTPQQKWSFFVDNIVRPWLFQSDDVENLFQERVTSKKFKDGIASIVSKRCLSKDTINELTRGHRSRGVMVGATFKEAWKRAHAAMDEHIDKMGVIDKLCEVLRKMDALAHLQGRTCTANTVDSLDNAHGAGPRHPSPKVARETRYSGQQARVSTSSSSGSNETGYPAAAAVARPHQPEGKYQFTSLDYSQEY